MSLYPSLVIASKKQVTTKKSAENVCPYQDFLLGPKSEATKISAKKIPIPKFSTCIKKVDNNKNFC